MRRVVSYGGPSGVPASQRLKHRLSSSPGLHLLSCTSLEVEGFLAATEEQQDGRVIHRTSRATHNFYATASTLKKVAKREPWVTRKDPFSPFVKERTIFDEPVEGEENCSDNGPSRHVTDPNGQTQSGPRGEDIGLEVSPEGSMIVPLNGTEVRGEGNLWKSASNARSSDNLTDVTAVSFDGNEVCRGSDISESQLVSNVVNSPNDLSWHDQRAQCSAVGSGLRHNKLDQSDSPSINPAEADVSSSTSAPCTRPDAQTFRRWTVEPDPTDIGSIPSVEKQDLVETGPTLQHSDWDPSSVQFKIMAAVQIQKCYRGWVQRKIFKQVKEAVVSLQSLKAATMLQKKWRMVQSVRFVKHLKTEQAVREERKIENAALVVQKHWRAVQSRQLVKSIEMERAVSAQQKMHQAAVLLQKHWRALESRWLATHLKMERAHREQQEVDEATIVLQKHWRARQSRHLVKYLKIEQVAREQQRVDHAAVVLQKYWRAEQSRRLVKRLKIEQAVRQHERVDNAATVLQKHWRSLQSRCLVRQMKVECALREQAKFAATVLQKHWRAHQSRLVVHHLKMEQVAREQQRLRCGALVLQKIWRAEQIRRLVRHLKMEQAVREQQRVFSSAVVLQKHWRARQSRSFVKHLKMDQAVREQQRFEYAALLIQKHWRAEQGRRLVKSLKLEKSLREWERFQFAAVVLQKHWLGLQSRRLATHMKMERVLREQQKVVNAAIVLQKNWRAEQSRRLLKHLKVEQAVREQETVYNGAVVLQKHWRAQQSRQLLKHLKMEQAAREQQRIAATVLQKHWQHAQRRRMNNLNIEKVRREQGALRIQAHVRGNAFRVTMKTWHLAALTIQKAWKQYWTSRRTVSAVCIQLAFRSYTIRKRKIQAAIVLGFRVQHRLGQLPKSADVVLEPDHTCNEMCVKASVGAGINSDMVFCSELNLLTRGASVHLLKEEVFSGHCSSPSLVQHDVCVQSADQTYSSLDSLQRFGCVPISAAEKHDFGLGLGLDHEFPATAVGELHVGKNGAKEDWNYVAVDHLEECLDTCLAALRPLPPTFSTSNLAQHCLPMLDLPDEVQQLDTIDQSVGSTAIVNRMSAPLELPTRTDDICQQIPRTLSAIGESGNALNVPTWSPSGTPGARLDQVTWQAFPLCATDQEDYSSGAQQREGAQQNLGTLQGKSLQRQTLKQNEQRLKEFAQVFLLQRHIALQQQHAQGAPPFPPPMPSRTGFPSQLAICSPEAENGDSCFMGDRGQGIPQNITVHTDASPSRVAGGMRLEPHLICEVTDQDDQASLSEQHLGSQNLVVSTEDVSVRPQPDVVLDMVLLLRRIEAEYGTSESNLEGESSTWFSSRCSDIEEGMPLLDRNLGSIRRQNSVVNFMNSVGIKRISIPDLNAMLLVLIAMVAYTRTICRGVIFGTRQTHRRI